MRWPVTTSGRGWGLRGDRQDGGGQGSLLHRSGSEKHTTPKPRSDIHKMTKLPAYTVTTCVTKSPTATSTSDIHKITNIPRLHCKLPPTHSLAL